MEDTCLHVGVRTQGFVLNLDGKHCLDVCTAAANEQELRLVDPSGDGANLIAILSEPAASTWQRLPVRWICWTLQTELKLVDDHEGRAASASLPISSSQQGCLKAGPVAPVKSLRGVGNHEGDEWWGWRGGGGEEEMRDEARLLLLLLLTSDMFWSSVCQELRQACKDEASERDGNVQTPARRRAAREHVRHVLPDLP
eukprot:446229-Hanusia_phi.AAC.1